MYIDKQVQLEKTVQAQERLITEMKHALSENKEMMCEYLKKQDEGYRVIETDILEDMKSMELQVKERDDHITNIEEEKQLLVQEKDKADNDRQDEHRRRVDIDKEMKVI